MFGGADITVILLIIWVAVPYIVSFMGVQWALELAIWPELSEWHQYSRVLLNAVSCTNQTPMVLGAICLYYFRVVERMMGSRKFAYAVAKIWVSSVVVVPATLKVLSLLGVLLRVPPGPSTVIGGIAALFHVFVPPVYCFKVRGVGIFSDKVLPYLVMLQMIQGPGDALKLAVGWTMGKVMV